MESLASGARGLSPIYHSETARGCRCRSEMHPIAALRSLGSLKDALGVRGQAVHEIETACENS